MTLAIATEQQARDLTDRIKTAIGVAWDLIVAAHTTQAWKALGYLSWDDYCEREFGTYRIQVPRAERTQVVASLREAGLSVKAITEVTDMSDATVKRRLRGGQMTPPELDARPEIEHVLTEGECEDLDADDLDAEPPPDRTTSRIIGVDGRSYPPPPTPQARGPARKPLTAAFTDAVIALGKDTAKLTKLATDDRFKKHAEQLAETNLHDLLRTRDVLQDVITQLSTERQV